MRQEASFFEGKEPALVYIAKKLKDALRLEDVFSGAGVDYGVEADEYRGDVVFRSVRVGAFFYVLPEDQVPKQLRQSSASETADCYLSGSPLASRPRGCGRRGCPVRAGAAFPGVSRSWRRLCSAS